MIRSLILSAALSLSGANCPPADSAMPEPLTDAPILCIYEDGSAPGQQFPCFWDASIQGNGQGNSYWMQAPDSDGMQFDGDFEPSETPSPLDQGPIPMPSEMSGLPAEADPASEAAPIDPEPSEPSPRCG